jgi:TatD DNase family protein
MLKRAQESKIEKIICIGTHPEDSMKALDFANQHENVYWTFGIHPEYATKHYDYNELNSLIQNQKKLVAIGEVGLDYHYELETREQQIKLFEMMCELATKNNLPLSFHVREAFDDFFAVINNFSTIHGVVHSFSDSKKNLKKILEQTDFYVGVNGMATYSTLPTPPLDRILLETDAPFLAPVPHRGETNEPAYIKNIAEWLSAKLNTNFHTVEEITTENVEKLFNI